MIVPTVKTDRRKTRPDIVIGESLERESGELARLLDSILAGQLVAQKVDYQPDGDVRYWGVDVSQSGILMRLKEFGESLFKQVTGTPPIFSFIMVNVTDSERCPWGSGGGWHRDSSRRQYKAFSYLTDVEKEPLGPLSFIPASNSGLLWLISMIYRIVTKGNRYQDSTINALFKLGIASSPVLLKAGIPFLLNTSLIHRGMPMSEGRRAMAAVYMFEDIERMSDDFKSLRQMCLKETQ
jgi:hypothetical protein